MATTGRIGPIRADALSRGKFLITKTDYASAVDKSAKKLMCAPGDIRFWLEERSGFFEIGEDDWQDAITDAKDAPVIVVTALSDPNESNERGSGAGGLDSPRSLSMRDTPINVDARAPAAGPSAGGGGGYYAPAHAERYPYDGYGHGGHYGYDRATSVQRGHERAASVQRSHDNYGRAGAGGYYDRAGYGAHRHAGASSDAETSYYTAGRGGTQDYDYYDRSYDHYRADGSWRQDASTSYDAGPSGRSADEHAPRPGYAPAKTVPRRSGAASFLESSTSWHQHPNPASSAFGAAAASSSSSAAAAQNGRAMPADLAPRAPDRELAHSGAARGKASAAAMERPSTKAERQAAAVAAAQGKDRPFKAAAPARAAAHAEEDEDLISPQQLYQKKDYRPSAKLHQNDDSRPKQSQALSTSQKTAASQIRAPDGTFTRKNGSAAKAADAARSKSRAPSDSNGKKRAAPPSENEDEEGDSDEEVGSIDWADISANQVHEKSSGKRWDNATCTKLIRALTKELKKRNKEVDEGVRADVGHHMDVYNELIKRNNSLKDRSAAAIHSKCKMMMEQAKARGKLRSIPKNIRVFLNQSSRRGPKRTSTDPTSDQDDAAGRGAEARVRKRFKKKAQMQAQTREQPINVGSSEGEEEDAQMLDSNEDAVEEDGDETDEEEGYQRRASKHRLPSESSSSPKRKKTSSKPGKEAHLNGVSNRAKRAEEANRQFREQQEEEEANLPTNSSETEESENDAATVSAPRPRPRPRPVAPLNDPDEQRKLREYKEQIAATNPFTGTAARLSQPPELPASTNAKAAASDRRPLFLKHPGVADEQDYEVLEPMNFDGGLNAIEANDDDGLDEDSVEDATRPEAPPPRTNGAPASSMRSAQPPGTPPRAENAAPARKEQAQWRPPPGTREVAETAEASPYESDGAKRHPGAYSRNPDALLPGHEAMPPPPIAAPAPPRVEEEARLLPPAPSDVDPKYLDSPQLARNFAMEEYNGLKNMTAFDTLAHVANTSDPDIERFRVRVREIMTGYVSDLTSPQEANYLELGNRLAELAAASGDRNGDQIFVPLIFSIFCTAFDVCDKQWSLRKVSLLACLTLIFVSRALGNRFEQNAPSDRNYKEKKMARPSMPHRRFRAYVTAFLLEGCLKTEKEYETSPYRGIFIRDNLAMFVALQPYLARQEWTLEAAFRPLADVSYLDANDQLDRLLALQDLIKKCKTAHDLTRESAWIQQDWLVIKTDPVPSGQIWDRCLEHPVPVPVSALLHDAQAKLLPRVAHLATDQKVINAANLLCSEVISFCAQFEEKDVFVPLADRIVILLNRADTKGSFASDVYGFAEEPQPLRPFLPIRVSTINMRAHGKTACVIFFKDREDRDGLLRKMHMVSKWRDVLVGSKCSQEEATYIVQVAALQYNISQAAEASAKKNGAQQQQVQANDQPPPPPAAPVAFKPVKPEPTY